MRYIAIEEAFSLAALAERQPMPTLAYSVRDEFAGEWERRLADIGELRLADMDESGVDVQVLSLTAPGMQVDIDPQLAVANARFANDRLSEAVAAHPSRFRGFAALPLQDPVAAAAELRRAVTELGFCGALVNNCASARYLDDPVFDVLWAELAALGVPLYLHPGSPAADTWDVLDGWPELYGAMWSWAAETAGHAMRIVLSGVFDRHPAATLILGHLGEFLPFQRSRFDSRWRTLATERRLARPPSAYLGGNVVFTISGVFSPATIAGAVAEVGAEALLFAIDYPYETSADAVRGFEATALSDDDRAAIAHGNAERLLDIDPAAFT